MDGQNCFVWDVDPVIFKVGSFSLRWYGLLFALGMMFGYFLLEWQFRRTKYPEDTAKRLFYYLFFGTLIGAFFGHRIFYEWEKFISNPGAAFSLKNGLRGLSSHGAQVGIFLGALIFHLRTKIRFVEVMDRISFGAALVASFVRVGNLMNSEIVGRKTEVAWAFCFPRYDHTLLIPRHPSQIYEVIVGLIVLGTLLLADKLAGGEKRPMGLLFGLFELIYFGLRFFVEFFKEYQTLSPDFALTMGQILSIPFFLIGIGMIIWAYKTRYPAAIVPEAERK